MEQELIDVLSALTYVQSVVTLRRVVVVLHNSGGNRYDVTANGSVYDASDQLLE